MAAILDDLTIGQLGRRVRIDKQVTTTDDHGVKVVTWAPRASLWASVEPLSNREAIQAGAVTSALLSAITIWYRTDLAITDRVVLGARTFQIQSFQDPTGGQVALRLVCIETQ